MENTEQKLRWPGWDITGILGQDGFGTLYEIERNVNGTPEKANLKVISVPQDNGEIDALRQSGMPDAEIAKTMENRLRQVGYAYANVRKLSACPHILRCDDMRFSKHRDGLGWDLYIQTEHAVPLMHTLPMEIPEETVRAIANSLGNALQTAADAGLTHGNLKLMNVFVSADGTYKLADFGVGLGAQDPAAARFMAPEVFSGMADARSDVYALGMLLYWLLNNRRLPFMTPDAVTQEANDLALQRRLNGEPLPQPANGSPALQNVVLQACNADPAFRFGSAGAMLTALNAAPVYSEPDSAYEEPLPVNGEPAQVCTGPASVFEAPQPVCEEPAPAYAEPQPPVYEEPAPVYTEPQAEAPAPGVVPQGGYAFIPEQKPKKVKAPKAPKAPKAHKPESGGKKPLDKKLILILAAAAAALVVIVLLVIFVLIPALNKTPDALKQPETAETTATPAPTHTPEPAPVLSIVRQPQSVTVKPGEFAEVTVEATGEGLTYAWYAKNAGQDAFVLSETVTGNVYRVQMDASRNGRELYCVITDALGESVTTETVTIAMEYTFEITAQPKDAVVKAGERAEVTVEATGEGLTYAWYYKNAGGKAFKKTDSMQEKTYFVEMNEERSGRRLYCVVTDAYGNSITTDTVVIRMEGLLQILRQPQSVTVAEGELAEVSLEAAGDGLTYAWYFMDADGKAFKKTDSIVGAVYSVKMNADRDGRRLYCEVTDEHGNTVRTDEVVIAMK